MKIYSRKNNILTRLVLINLIFLTIIYSEETISDVIKRNKDGSPQIIRFYHLDNNLQISSNYEEITYWKSGDIKSKETYKNGKRNGIIEFRFNNGNLMKKINYVNGIKKGTFESYYIEGQLKEKGKYNNY